VEKDNFLVICNIHVPPILDY